MRWGAPKSDAAKIIGTVKQLRGVLSFIYDVKKDHDERDIKEKWKDPTAIHNLFRKFLYFDKFHILQRPLIVCEGKTDSVYLRCAIRALAKSYPELIDLSTGKENILVDFFNYSKMNMDIMQFSGGTGDLAALIHYYEERMKPFLCDGRKFPVIILVDNDTGAKPVLEKATKLIGKDVDGTDAFYYIWENLYVVVLPKAKGTLAVASEDFFEKALLGVELDGKKFNPDEKTFDRNTQYGKHVFAEKVVKAGQKTIKFDGFAPVLDRLKAAIADYTTKAGKPAVT